MVETRGILIGVRLFQAINNFVQLPFTGRKF